VKRLDLVVGPNGAGKSTFIAFTLAPLLPRSLLVNADEIAKQRWPADPLGHAYDAARIAAATRAKLIQTGLSFIAETVFSHPSKLDLLRSAHDAGYHVALHVVMIPEDLAVERVKRRVRHGGHDVPEDKIRERPADSGHWPRMRSKSPTPQPSTTTPGAKARASSRRSPPAF
jgi:predicted ABC-type ATPase